MKPFLIRNVLRASLFCLVFMGIGSAGKASAVDAFAQNKLLGRGMNVLGYDPIWDSFSSARFKPDYFKTIHEGGFQSLRVNLQPFRHMGPAPEYLLPKAWWGTADWIVTNATAAGLAVILDCHEYETTASNEAAHRAKFIEFWRQLAAHYQKAPATVFFEILNEPNGEVTPAVWNQYIREVLPIIRESNPGRTVVIGPPFWNSIGHLTDLELPKDKNIIVTVHYYDPMKFTHQGAPWAGLKGKTGVKWEGTPQERARIALDFQYAQDWAKKNKRPVFLGEFGAYDDGDMESRARYTAAVARTAEKFGWSWAYWQFDSNFLAYDVQKNQWIGPIHNALVPPK
ncbi:MAG: glycoside hydrolase family 5 protein [Verrucomicrobiota bacterium]